MTISIMTCSSFSTLPFDPKPLQIEPLAKWVYRFIASCLPTAARLSGTDIILSQWILKSTTGAVITMLIPLDRASESMQGHADADSVHVATAGYKTATCCRDAPNHPLQPGGVHIARHESEVRPTVCTPATSVGLDRGSASTPVVGPASPAVTSEKPEPLAVPPMTVSGLTITRAWGQPGHRQEQDDPVNPHFPVRPEGADHQWRKVPSRELSVDLVADERGGWVTGRLEAS